MGLGRLIGSMYKISQSRGFIGFRVWGSGRYSIEVHVY